MKKGFRSRWQNCAACLLGLMLSGCTSYRPHPLPTAPDLAKAPDLTVSPKEFWLSGLPPHSVSPDGLDETTVVTLAVFNNPDLKIARLQSGVASAQLLEAGLLPDPQVGAGYASSALNYGGALSLSEDIQALITRGAAKASARAAEKQVNLNILWQEWQVAERATDLFIQARADDQLLGVLTATDELLSSRYHRDETAMQRGDTTSSTVAADLTALSDADAGLRQLQIESDLNRHQLNALLGLQPDLRLPLIGPTATEPLTQDQFRAAVDLIPRRRTDLLALQAGYKSQEETVRRAVLAQFPSLSAGVEQARDPVEGVNSIGLNVNLTLPLFNRNRGQIAIQRATREVLWQTYQAQLDAAYSQADQVWKATQIMAAQQKDLDAQLPVLEKTFASAEQSYRQGNLDAGLYVSLESSLLAKRAESIRLQATLDTARSTLSILLGLPFQAP